MLLPKIQPIKLPFYFQPKWQIFLLSWSLVLYSISSLNDKCPTYLINGSISSCPYFFCLPHLFAVFGLNVSLSSFILYLFYSCRLLSSPLLLLLFISPFVIRCWVVILLAVGINVLRLVVMGKINIYNMNFREGSNIYNMKFISFFR